ncbi:MAG: hypothetical protein AAFS05_02935 [Pseudomonadota bacterium]
MTQRLCAAAALVACVTAPAAAQDWYGGAAVTLDRFSTDDDGTDRGNATGLGGQGFAGVAFGDRLYAEGDLSLSGVSSIQDPFQLGLVAGEVLAGRFGRDFGAFSVEGVLGTMTAVSGESDVFGLPDIERGVLAISGSYRLNDDLVGGLMIGRLDGDGDGASNADAFRDLTHLMGHVDYRLNADWTIVGSAAFGSGVVDQDDDDASVRALAVEARYGLPKLGLTAFVGLSNTYMKQTDPDDVNDNDDASRVGVFAGVRWVFGANGATRARSRVPLPDYLTWLAMSDGILE